MSQNLDYFNFVIYPDYFNRYDLINPSYDYDIKQFLQNKNGLIILFTTPKLPDFYEILTRGDGSCFYYSLEKINSELHIKRKMNYLINELKDVFKNNKNINIENYLPIPPKTIDDCSKNLEKDNSINNNTRIRIKNYYNNYMKYKTCIYHKNFLFTLSMKKINYC